MGVGHQAALVEVPEREVVAVAVQSVMQGIGAVGVSQDGIPPVAVLLVQVFEIVEGGVGGGLYGKAFVTPFVDGEAITHGHQWRQAPNATAVANGIVGAHRAQCQGQVFHLLWHATQGQGRVEERLTHQKGVGEGFGGVGLHHLVEPLMVGHGQGALQAVQLFDNPIAVRRHTTIVGHQTKHEQPKYFQQSDFHHVVLSSSQCGPLF